MVQKNCLKSSYIKIQIFQTISDGEMTKTKIVDVEELQNFIVNNVFIWNHLFKKNNVWIFHIWNLKISKDLKLRND
jgi:hypothetical protein